MASKRWLRGGVGEEDAACTGTIEVELYERTL